MIQGMWLPLQVATSWPGNVMCFSITLPGQVVATY